jgi:hypothetical protein
MLRAIGELTGARPRRLAGATERSSRGAWPLRPASSFFLPCHGCAWRVINSQCLLGRTVRADRELDLAIQRARQSVEGVYERNHLLGDRRTICA